jgi:hypothetical protein
MSTEFINDQWRLPNNENKSKQSNYSMDFNGSSQYVDTSDAFTSLTSFSISAWFKSDNTVSSNQPIVSSRINSISSSKGVDIFLSNNILYARVYNNGATAVTTSFTDTSNWHHVVMTYNGTTLDLFLDNTSLGTSTGVYANSAANWLIGKWNAGANYFDGQIDAVSIYNYALSSSQVTTLYGSSSTGIGNPMSLSPKPVAYYQLGDKSAFNGANYLVTNIAAEEADGDIATSFSPYALEFDGANDYIDLDSFAGELSTGDAYGLSLWFKGDGTNDFRNALFSAHTSSKGNVVRLLITHINNSTHVRYLDGGNNGAFQGDYDNNKWHNVVVTKSTGTSTLTLYIDGSSIGTISNCNPDFSNATLFSIGQEWDTAGTSDFFSGQISNVSVWNAELTSAQVIEIYNEGVPSNLNNHSAYSNLVSWWQLGSNSSFNTNWTVLDEVTASSNNGTSVNMGEDAIVDGVGSYANGLSSGMGGDEVIGSAPFSDANSLSINMDVLDRVEDTPA